MNNVYSQLPARMDDGRNYTIWDPAAVINEKIRQQENITSNREYRAYLQKNAISIMKINVTKVNLKGPLITGLTDEI